MCPLQTVEVSKAGGPDQISGRMLKATATSIAAPVTKLFNQFIFQDAFKQCGSIQILCLFPKMVTKQCSKVWTNLLTTNFKQTSGETYCEPPVTTLGGDTPNL